MKLSGQAKHSDEVSIISASVEIKGDLNTTGNIRIDGFISGNINSTKDIIFGKTAEIKGEIKGNNITVAGKIKGKIISKGKLILESTGILNGDIEAQIFVINEGASFNGLSKMELANEDKSNSESVNISAK